MCEHHPTDLPLVNISYKQAAQKPLPSTSQQNNNATAKKRHTHDNNSTTTKVTTDLTEINPTAMALADLKQDILNTVQQDFANLTQCKIAPLKQEVANLTTNHQTLNTTMIQLQQQMAAFSTQMATYMQQFPQPLRLSHIQPRTEAALIKWNLWKPYPTQSRLLLSPQSQHLPHTILHHPPTDLSKTRTKISQTTTASNASIYGFKQPGKPTLPPALLPAQHNSQENPLSKLPSSQQPKTTIGAMQSNLNHHQMFYESSPKMLTP